MGRGCADIVGLVCPDIVGLVARILLASLRGYSPPARFDTGLLFSCVGGTVPAVQIMRVYTPVARSTTATPVGRPSVDVDAVRSVRDLPDTVPATGLSRAGSSALRL